MTVDPYRECPAPSCPHKIARDKFACRDHWFSLPHELRREISTAWRRLLRDGEPGDLFVAQEKGRRFLRGDPADE